MICLRKYLISELVSRRAAVSVPQTGKAFGMFA